jgi:hypothetical protein
MAAIALTDSVFVNKYFPKAALSLVVDDDVLERYVATASVVATVDERRATRNLLFVPWRKVPATVEPAVWELLARVRHSCLSRALYIMQFVDTQASRDGIMDHVLVLCDLLEACASAPGTHVNVRMKLAVAVWRVLRKIGGTKHHPNVGGFLEVVLRRAFQPTYAVLMQGKDNATKCRHLQFFVAAVTLMAADTPCAKVQAAVVAVTSSVDFSTYMLATVRDIPRGIVARTTAMQMCKALVVNVAHVATAVWATVVVPGLEAGSLFPDDVLGLVCSGFQPWLRPGFVDVFGGAAAAAATAITLTALVQGASDKMRPRLVSFVCQLACLAHGDGPFPLPILNFVHDWPMLSPKASHVLATTLASCKEM